MTTPAPSIVLPVRVVDPADPADPVPWFRARVTEAFATLGFDMDRRVAMRQGPPGEDVIRWPTEVVDWIVQVIVADGARVVHVLAEVPPAPANVATWNLGDPNPPADFLPGMTGPDVRPYRLAAWAAFRFAAPEGPVYVTRSPLGRQAGPAGRPGGDAGPRGDE